MMSSRSRSSNIPIPNSPTNTRHIENVISIPQSPTQARQPPRSIPRSTSRTFEPRVIRLAPNELHDLSCPPTAARRPSVPAYPSQSTYRTTRLVSVSAPIPLQPTLSSDVFPVPSYLDHSAFRSSLFVTAPKPDPATSRSYGAIQPTTPSSDSDEESIASPPPPPPQLASSNSINTPLSYKLPTKWNVQDRHHFLSVSPDGRDLIYNGSSINGDKDGAAIKANAPIPPVCGIYYYEVEIRGKEQKSHVSIGFAGPKFKVSRLPGWEKDSWGYHGDDGYSFAADKTGIPYSHTYGSGDKIGCGIDFSMRRAFYTKNGHFLGYVFDNVGRGIDLYPSIGLQHSQENIRVNFGQDPFMFDIDNHVMQQKTNVWNKIMDTPLHITPTIGPPSPSGPSSKAPLAEEDSKDMLNNLVMSYLVHHGYAKTVRSFQKQRQSTQSRALVLNDSDVTMEGTSTDPAEGIEDDIERRKRIVNAVTSGDIDSAIIDTQLYHPTVLEAEAGLMKFKLRCRKFVELVLATRETQAASTSSPSPPARSSPTPGGDWLEDDMGMDMDVDDDTGRGYFGGSGASMRNGLSHAGFSDGTNSHRAKARLEAALSAAIEYGQAIDIEYKSDPRPEVQSLFKQTFGILAHENPLEAGNEVAAFVSKEARASLAAELNQAILKSQGLPVRPELERLYRHTAACVTQLGILGEGEAAFADLNRDLLDAC